jgi:hypothetical protein
VVVSSVTPITFERRVEYHFGSCASLALIELKRQVSSALVGFEMTAASFSARAPMCRRSVASPPSSRIMLVYLGWPFSSLPHSKMRWV